MSDIHLCFHGFEVIGGIRLDLTAHSFPAPLLETIELSVHFGKLRLTEVYAYCSGDIKITTKIKQYLE